MVGGTILTNLLAARWQMGFSLGWHIVLASLGVAFPSTDRRGRRRGDPVTLLADVGREPSRSCSR
jgi:hypothetical protein